MKRMQSGFTLIELVVVIIILGILAVTAIPRFIDLSQEANVAATKGIASEVSAASAINFAGYVAGDAAAQSVTAADTCTTAANKVATLPTGYTTDTTAFTGAAAGDQQTCTITGPGSPATTATATIVVTN